MRNAFMMNAVGDRMKFSLMTGAAVMALSVVALGASSASATSLYDWSFSNASDSGMGTFTTATPWTPAGVAITGVTGEIDSQSILSLSGYAGADNDLRSTFPFVSQGGISLMTAVDTYNIANINNLGEPGLIIQSVDPSGTSNGQPITFSVVAVPEPATWAIMLTGFAGLGAAMRSRRKQAAATV
jgi:hypothetical protein